MLRFYLDLGICELSGRLQGSLLFTDLLFRGPHHKVGGLGGMGQRDVLWTHCTIRAIGYQDLNIFDALQGYNGQNLTLKMRAREGTKLLASDKMHRSKSLPFFQGSICKPRGQGSWHTPDRAHCVSGLCASISLTEIRCVPFRVMSSPSSRK